MRLGDWLVIALLAIIGISYATAIGGVFGILVMAVAAFVLYRLATGKSTTREENKYGAAARNSLRRARWRGGA